MSLFGHIPDADFYPNSSTPFHEFVASTLCTLIRSQHCFFAELLRLVHPGHSLFYGPLLVLILRRGLEIGCCLGFILSPSSPICLRCYCCHQHPLFFSSTFYLGFHFCIAPHMFQILLLHSQLTDSWSIASPSSGWCFLRNI